MKNKLKLMLATSALLIGGLGGFAAAKNFGHHGHGKKELIKKFDTNADGKLDDTERADMKTAFGAMRAQNKAARIAKFDADNSGALDAGEREAMHATKVLERFTALDTNRDGKLTLDEFKAGRNPGHHRAMRKQP